MVTGAARGLGRVIALTLAREGYTLVLADVTDPSRAAAEVAEVGGGTTWPCRTDVSDEDEVRALADEVRDRFGRADVLVNNAGISLLLPAEQTTAEAWRRVLEVNLTGPFLLGQRFGPGMAERGWGRIINVVSQQAVRAFGRSGAYGASKGGLASLTRSQSEAWAARGVCCNAVSPGFVITPLTWEAASDPERCAALAARTMIGRNGEAGDFEGVAVFLASRASAYVTGQVIFVDGGFSAT